MGLVETEALVLKSYGLSEADKIVVFLTRDHGVVRGVAKGAKRMKSRFGSSLEPFSIVRLSYFQKEERELVSISGAEIVRSFFGVTAEPGLFEHFAYLVELLSDFAPPADPNERLYKMATICLETIDENPESAASMVCYFELWLLKLGGYLPSWERCPICGRNVEEGEATFLEANFQSACGNCRRGSGRKTLTSELRATYLAIQTSSPKRFLEFADGKTEVVREMSGILKSIIALVLGREAIR